MYVPGLYRSTNWATAQEIIQSYPLATIITVGTDGRPFANHLPLFLEEDRIFGHMARENTQVEHLAHGGEALLIFHGPQAYVSSRWYGTTPNAPTWNYVTLHINAHSTLVEDRDELLRILRKTTSSVDSAADAVWASELVPEKWLDQMVQQIVGVEFKIERFDCKLKLGQNKKKEELRSAVAGLRESPRKLPDLADWMERENGC